jgi:hypothetical protein
MYQEQNNEVVLRAIIRLSKKRVADTKGKGRTIIF